MIPPLKHLRNTPAPAANNYTVFERVYEKRDIPSTEQDVKPYAIAADSREKALDEVERLHSQQPGYSGSQREHSTIISSFQEDKKRVAVVEAGELERLVAK